MRALAAVVAAVLCAPALLGGCGLGTGEFDPVSPDVTAARVRAHADSRSLLRRAARGHPTLAQTGLDGCLTGRPDAEQRGGWAHDCSVVDSRLVVLARDEDAVPATLTAYDAALRALRCRPADGPDLAEVVTRSWRADDPQVVARGAAALPAVRYACPEAVTVVVQSTSAREGDPDPRTALGPPVVQDRLLSGKPFDATALAGLVGSRAALAAVLTTTRHYYRTRS